MHLTPLRLRQRLTLATGLLLWGSAECLALWRSRRVRREADALGLRSPGRIEA